MFFSSSSSAIPSIQDVQPATPPEQSATKRTGTDRH
jgi:hypothetical protein